MGKYSLPKVVDSYSVVEICKMKNLQVRPYALSEFPLEGAHKSFKDELAIVSHFLHNKRLGINVNFASEASLLMQELSAELLARQGMLGEPRMAEPDMFADFFNVPFLPKQGADFTFIDLFAGIGGFRLAMQAVGGKCIFSSEFNEPAQKTYFANYGDMPFGDITLEETKRYIPENFDVLCAGFPCQAFSIIGKQKGFADTRGTMFFEIQKILQRHRPKAIFMENVKQLVTHDKGKTFKVILGILADLGYYVKWKVLNALDFGVPQKRERVIIVGFLDKKKTDLFSFDFEKKPYSLSDILQRDDEVDESLFVSDRILQKRKDSTKDKNVFYPSIWHENKAGNISVLDYACALRTGASYNYLLVNGYRRPSSRELLRLQGFPEDFKIVVSHQEIRRQTGNSVAVPMMTEVAKRIKALL
ncbi:MAG TPA: DNA (cytosine-5-)-methyltransferase [Prevotella sp.]|nr:DNA (cytosine-5-)-methyltransferase [uncultured Prevotella sp.]HRM56952.1 DNA (cytosine-5-)-methyltransferase [Prevotella sp.]